MFAQSDSTSNENNASNVASQSDNSHSKNKTAQLKPLSEKSTRELGKLISRLEIQIVKFENERHVLQNNLAKLNNKLNELKQKQAEASKMLFEKRKQEQQRK
ncbi:MULTISPECIES: hypothetical protein [Helicobacter]|uniref:Uncharacterized protein n=1 Tax=Helicobacter suis TaxID=104628 RepID=A0A6J4D026_9HELI|nr:MULTISPECIES: hypothetical protein [Helicobacter]CRF49663.1 hypothetical protein HHE03_12950 [Helicobacter heilmannii]BCD48543.1 hypothetical protein NHP194003_17470 [Helicobacter suis]BCD50112.1 hypothetical protein NHP194004_15590 [Helicobacter suis]BCD50322.1 hypothetical protein NHP194004_17690 [Helicobacter suis]BCD71089.1 hypothetical protein SNTW_17340 [Helicobacter suis]